MMFEPMCWLGAAAAARLATRRHCDVSSARPSVRCRTKAPLLLHSHHSRSASAATMATEQEQQQHEADVSAFRTDGYVKLPPDLLAPEDLGELRRVYKREQAYWRTIRDEERGKAMADPEKSWRSPGYYDIPWTAETDDAFLKLACNPRLVKIVESIVGDDVFLQDLRARTVLGLNSQHEGDGTFGGRAYTGGFHHDGGQIGFADHPTLSQSVKLFFAISDQDVKIGCTSVIGGTHRIGEGGWGESPVDSPRAADYGLGNCGQDAAHGGGGRSPQELDAVSGQDAFETAAGGSLLMDLRCWHTALPCRSDRDREGFILQYSPFKQKQEVLTREAGIRMHAEGKLTTPIQRQVMGIELQPWLSAKVPEPLGTEVCAAWDPTTINTPNLASPSYPEPPPAALQPAISSFRIDGFVRVPQLISGAQLAETQAAFTAATADGVGQPVSLVEHVGVFVSVLALPKLLELAGELMPFRYEGTPQCVALTGHTAASSGGWRRDYSRPARDIVLLGPPTPPQHMADELKVYIALQDQPMPLVSFGTGSHRTVGVPEDESPSVWEARAGDAMLVDGRSRYNDDALGDGGAFMVATYASKKQKNEAMRAAAMLLDDNVLQAAGEDAAAVLGVRRRGDGFGGGSEYDAPNTGGLPRRALRRVWQPAASL